MRDAISQFLSSLKQGLQLAAQFSGQKAYSRVVICGMGGSSIPGIFLSFVKEDIVVWQDYGLPNNIHAGDLVVCISWSGNTQETISSFNKAQELGLETYIITKGGALGEKTKTQNIPTIILPDKSLPARLGAGYMTGALFGLLGLERELPLSAMDTESEGKQLAEMIGQKVPVIYAPYNLRKIALFWKILFNENTKLPALWNSLPAAVHNEIEIFTSQNKDHFFPILIKDGVHKDIDTAIAFFNQIGYNYHTVNLSGQSLLGKALNSYIFGLWTSYLLAQNLGIDPEKTELIETFKRLKKE